MVRSVSLTQESRMGHGVAGVQGEKKLWNATIYLSVKMQELSWKISKAPSHSNIPGSVLELDHEKS